MFRLTVLDITFLLSVLIAPVASLAADDRPVPPADPKSEEECRAYQRQQIDYARIALQKSRECDARNRATNNQDVVLYQSSCGGGVLSAFSSCRELSDAAWCALAGMSEKMSACVEKASAAEQKRLTNARAQNEQQKQIEAEKLLQGQGAAAERGTDDLRRSLQGERELASRSAQDAAAARRDVETHTASAAKASNDASQRIQAADQGCAELKRSLQKEHERAEALAKELSLARAAVYAYEAQAHNAGEQAVDSKPAAENGGAELRKSLQQEQERTARLEQDLGTAHAQAAKAGSEAARLKRAADDNSAESLRLLQQEREKTSRLEQELASERTTKKAVLAGSEAMTTGQVARDKQPRTQATRPVTQTTTAAAQSNAEPDAEKAAEVTRFMARASALLGRGDIASARIVLERAVEMGSAQANFALAETYDPHVLRKWGAYGTLGDAAKALDFYARAQAGGINEAKGRLDALRR